ncbi:hypothetical protein [Anaeromyxobacter terrae]|uniref:hypothetical protein n=1 Tax=Anaeromyxobacter terrae TaxID=2925406 RepID=UPI001F5A6754|nr:hypothetical protein [Anaeromyxobacter sp. SG22]
MTAGSTRPVAVGAFAAVLAGLSLLHLGTGLADNGDFDRSTYFLLEKPAGFATNWPPYDTPERARRILGEWHDRWELAAGAPRLHAGMTASSYKPILAAQVGLDRLVTGDGEYSFVVGSLPLRAVLVAGVVALVATAAAEAPAAAVVLALLLGLAALETSFAAFLNSAFEDQVAIVFLPLLALFTWRAAAARSRRAALAGLAVAALVGAAKPAFFYLPLLAAPFLWSALRVTTTAGRAAAVAAVVLAQAIALVPPLVNRATTRVNAYQALYYGALLPLSGAELAEVRVRGAPAVRECVGVRAFVRPEGPACLERAPGSLAAAAAILATHPRAAAALLGRAVAKGADVELAYLSKRAPGRACFAELPPFRFWTGVFRRLGRAVLALSLLAAASLHLAPARVRGSGAARAAGLLAVFGALQYPVSLADGLVETQKHVLVGNYSNVLALSLAAAVLAAAAARALRRAPPRPEEEALAHARTAAR